MLNETHVLEKIAHDDTARFLVIDTACQRSVVGTSWMLRCSQRVKAQLGHTLHIHVDDERFKFGDGALRPYLGANIGGIYGEDVNDTLAAGPEAGRWWELSRERGGEGRKELLDDARRSTGTPSVRASSSSMLRSRQTTKAPAPMT